MRPTCSSLATDGRYRQWRRGAAPVPELGGGASPGERPAAHSGGAPGLRGMPVLTAHTVRAWGSAVPWAAGATPVEGLQQAVEGRARGRLRGDERQQNAGQVRLANVAGPRERAPRVNSWAWGRHLQQPAMQAPPPGWLHA